MKEPLSLPDLLEAVDKQTQLYWVTGDNNPIRKVDQCTLGSIKRSAAWFGSKSGWRYEKFFTNYWDAWAYWQRLKSKNQW